MEIKLINDNWHIDDEYVIIENVEGSYEVHTISQYGDSEETAELYKSKSFENCLTWCWNS